MFLLCAVLSPSLVYLVGKFQTASQELELVVLPPRHAELDRRGSAEHVILIGDSHIHSLRLESLEDGTKVRTYGVPGDTSAGVLRRIEQLQTLGEADAVFIAVGFNDLRNTPQRTVIENIVESTRKIPPGPVILVGAVLPIDMPARADWQGRDNQLIKAFNASLARRLQQYPRVIFVDSRSLLVDAQGGLAPSHHVGDGLHLSEEANRLWANHLRGRIQEALERY